MNGARSCSALSCRHKKTTIDKDMALVLVRHCPVETKTLTIQQMAVVLFRPCYVDPQQNTKGQIYGSGPCPAPYSSKRKTSALQIYDSGSCRHYPVDTKKNKPSNIWLWFLFCTISMRAKRQSRAADGGFALPKTRVRCDTWVRSTAKKKRKDSRILLMRFPASTNMPGSYESRLLDPQHSKSASPLKPCTHCSMAMHSNHATPSSCLFSL